MDIRIDKDFKNSQTAHDFCFYQSGYLSHQKYDHSLAFLNENHLVYFTLQGSTANSIDNSPFGSFLKLSNEKKKTFSSFQESVESCLKDEGISKICIKHPSPIYYSFEDPALLASVGYSALYNDINQHIVLDDNWENGMHKMQKRKYQSLLAEGFDFKIIESESVESVHQFLSVCRQSQGLQINISLEKLQNLIAALPGRYDLFGIFRDGKISAACISVRVTNDIAYYYLAGTSPLFRSSSPMVLLISEMATYYKNLGFNYFDLGISSIEGKAQETLRLFKERMGAIESIKPTFIKLI